MLSGSPSHPSAIYFNRKTCVKLKHRLLAACAAAALCAPVFATQVTYSYSGVVDDDPATRGWVSFSGSFSFDSTASDGIADPSTAAYAMAGPPYGMSVVFNDGSNDALSDIFNVLVSDNLGGWDWFGVLAQNASATQSLGFTLLDFTASLFSSDALPLPPGGLTLANFGSAQFVYETTAGYLQGHLDALTCTSGCNAVARDLPEPATGALVLSGLLAAGMHTRRRRPPTKP